MVQNTMNFGDAEHQGLHHHQPNMQPIVIHPCSHSHLALKHCCALLVLATGSLQGGWPTIPVGPGMRVPRVWDSPCSNQENLGQTGMTNHPVSKSNPLSIFLCSSEKHLKTLLTPSLRKLCKSISGFLSRHLMQPSLLYSSWSILDTGEL